MLSFIGKALFLLGLVWVNNTAGQVIKEHPKDVTVFPEDVGVLSCVTLDEATRWTINDTDIDDLPSGLHGDLVTNSVQIAGRYFFTLNITGRVEYNGTRVQCVATGEDDNPGESMNATLSIQDVLSPVVDLRTSSSATSVTISWTAPFSLDVTGVDPDIWYSVLIYNVTDEPTAVPCTDCINITETHYTFTPDYPSPCQEYIFTVIPLNGAGQGETSHNVTGYTIDDLNIQVAEPVIKAINNSLFQVVFNISGSVCNYSLPGVDQSSTQLMDSGEDEVAIVYILSANINYTSFEISNAASSGNISFTTFDVQNVTARTSGSEVIVTAVFAANSPAKGLFVVFASDDGSPDEFRALLRDGQGESSITVPPSTYTLLVYDLEEDALPNEKVAFIQKKTLIVKKENGNPNTASTSEFIKGANIYISGSKIQITCIFSDYPESSCVLVYREYGNTTLVVEEYSHSNKPPGNIVLDKPDSTYTFAIFGKNGKAGIDPEPVATKRYMKGTEKTEIPLPPPPANKIMMTGEQDESTATSTSTVILPITVTISVLVIIATIIVAVILVLRWRRKFCKPPTIQSNISGNEIALEQGEETSFSPPAVEGPLEEECKYASVVVVPKTNPPPIVDPPVQYQEIDLKATKRQAHPHGLLYAELGAPPPYTKKVIKPPSTKSTTQYVDVLPHATIPTDNTASDNKEKDEKTTEQQPVETPRVPPTVEEVMSLLWSVAGLWKVIAEGLEFDEDLIDEIDTNNERDEACLQDCVEKWVRKLDPTWEKLFLVLTDMGQESLAQQTCQSGGFVVPSEVSAASGSDGASQFVSGSCGLHQITSNEEETRGSKPTVEDNSEQSDITRALTILQEESHTDDITYDYITAHDITSHGQHEVSAELETGDAVTQSVPSHLMCCNNASLAVYGGGKTPCYPVPDYFVSGFTASLGGMTKLTDRIFVKDTTDDDVALDVTNVVLQQPETTQPQPQPPEATPSQFQPPEATPPHPQPPVAGLRKLPGKKTSRPRKHSKRGKKANRRFVKSQCTEPPDDCYSPSGISWAGETVSRLWESIMAKMQP